MPKGPKGEKRPADVIGPAITVAKIATVEIEEKTDGTVKTRSPSSLAGRLRRKTFPTTAQFG